ncbi:hypothetical protein Ae717Ps2_6567c [Pseudonocardia sp. Ae717_Ps2]|nr:hypothetical protein Ae717Ps2_6514c [Pseudonocardia sp. Ae717_Ps2]OLM28329.1 hypothetical protein Ae717Ps2_6531c [Pseudonocardia sp. Ae717_Ps2]OLM28365.1 hypothetical protein Ae717Ps2_6567c [Pseudonocardia sp. Ae717_Ps2]
MRLVVVLDRWGVCVFGCARECKEVCVPRYQCGVGRGGFNGFGYGDCCGRRLGGRGCICLAFYFARHARQAVQPRLG